MSFLELKKNHFGLNFTKCAQDMQKYDVSKQEIVNDYLWIAINENNIWENNST